MPIVFLLTACFDTNSKKDSADTGYLTEMICEEAVGVECQDALFLDLGLQDTISDGAITNTVDGNDYITTIDATAGGYQQAATSPWVYLRFTNDGAEKVEISDEEALKRLDWDMSLRRFLLRLNGGSSGPSCVGAAVFMEESYSSLSDVPEATPFTLDNYYTSDCSLINDSSGLDNSPQTALSPWWEYPGCVATTGYPFAIQLADGRLVKMVVEQYYAEGQDVCNESGNMGSGSANFTIRWSFLN